MEKLFLGYKMSTIKINKYIGGLLEHESRGTLQMCEIIPPQTSTLGDEQVVSNGYYSIVVDK